jgi:hypothetical protein
MLIDTRDHRPEPEPEREPRRLPRPDLAELRPLWPFAQALALLIVAGWLPPLPAYAVILTACAVIGRGLGNLLSMGGDGMRDHRQ